MKAGDKIKKIWNLIKKFLMEHEGIVSFIITFVFIILFYFHEKLLSPTINEFLTRIITEFFEVEQDSARNFYLTQVSTSFIVITIMNVLSDKTNTLYWDDIVESKLVHPPYRNIKSFMRYSFLALLISTLGLISHKTYIVSLSFGINVIILVVLSYKMLDIYFNRERNRQKLIRKYYKTEVMAEKEKLLLKLRENTLLAICNSNSDIVNENIDFYINDCKYSDVYYLMNYIDSVNFYFAEKIMEGFAQKTANKINRTSNVEEIQDIMRENNSIYYLSQGIKQNFINGNSNLIWDELFEKIMLDYRGILVAAYSKIFNVKIQVTDISYGHYRSEIRYNIDKFMRDKREYSANDMLQDLEHSVEDKIGIRYNRNELSKIRTIECNMEIKKLFHDAIRFSATREILSLIKEIVDSPELDDGKKCYYLTVFIFVFTCFPIFGYLYCLDTNYNNNTMYNKIVRDLEYLAIEGERILNDDWKGLYAYIVGNKCDNSNLGTIESIKN